MIDCRVNLFGICKLLKIIFKCFLYLKLFFVIFLLKNFSELLFLCLFFISVLMRVDLFELFFLIKFIILLGLIENVMLVSWNFEFLYDLLSC